MRVLALDTAMAQVAVALWEGDPGTDGRVLAARATPMERGQAEALLPMVADVMADAGADFASLDRIAATRGPGAFTGIRIGLAAARGLGLAANVPVVGIATTAAIAANVPAGDRAGRALLIALDTKRGDFYAAAALPDGAPGAPAVVAPDGLAALVGGGGDVICAGDGAAAAVDILCKDGRAAAVATAPPVPDAAVVARLAAAVHVGEAADAPEPLYLRPPAVNLPGVGRIG